MDQNYPPPIFDSATHTTYVPLEFSQKYLQKLVELTDDFSGRFHGRNEPDVNTVYPTCSLGTFGPFHSEHPYPFIHNVDGIIQYDVDNPLIVSLSINASPSNGDECGWNGTILFHYRHEFKCWQDIDYATGDIAVLLFPKKELSWDCVWDSVGTLYHEITE